MVSTQNAREQVDFEETSKQNTIEAYREFLAKYPQGRFSEQARAQVSRMEVEDAAWEEAKRLDTLEAYVRFQVHFPGSRATEVEEKILAMSRSMVASPAPDALATYLANAPGDSMVYYWGKGGGSMRWDRQHNCIVYTLGPMATIAKGDAGLIFLSDPGDPLCFSQNGLRYCSGKGTVVVANGGVKTHQYGTR